VRTVVVYVHGLWLNGWESLLLRQRLSRELDCNALSFRYSSMGAGLRANALSLAAFLTRLHADTLHLVGHSMGGAVILELFEGALDGGDAAARSAMLPPGRIVLLGSPLRGSRAARNLSRWPLGRRLLGPTAHEVLLPELSRRWVAPRELGVIAGTVLVEETYLDGATEHLILHTTHSGMMCSAIVARQAAWFLRHGRFATKAGQT
jgi:pimeloyl-ACP methyl ester carboxylesterase